MFEKLYYFADPMCSWCYGFGPAIGAFAAHHADLPIELVMGGLRPYTREPAADKQKAEIRDHWRHVEKASGLPFDDALLMTPGFVYDTEPACRAVVVVRETPSPSGAADKLSYFKAVQVAFYRDARDVTSASVLADIAHECGMDRAAFLLAFATDETRDAVRADFSLTQSLGIRGFPTLCAARGNELHMLVNGYAPLATLEESFANLTSAA
jgi:putative protein-disulfide isomerase